jgi:hypothetical protein
MVDPGRQRPAVRVTGGQLQLGQMLFVLACLRKQFGNVFNHSLLLFAA